MPIISTFYIKFIEIQIYSLFILYIVNYNLTNKKFYFLNKIIYIRIKIYNLKLLCQIIKKKYQIT
jgi:hypothetical protein